MPIHSLGIVFCIVADRGKECNSRSGAVHPWAGRGFDSRDGV